MFADKKDLYERFRQVFEEYYVALSNYAFTFTKDRDVSEDIVQEIFLRIWEKRPDLIMTDTLRYYLFTSVRNNSLTRLKQDKRILSMHAVHLDNAQTVYPQEMRESELPDPVTQIQRALSLLPPKCKEVFLMSRIGQLSYKEIAKAMDISVKTVENQIGKALKIMKNFVKENKPKILFWAILSFQYLNVCFMGDFGKPVFF